jgi:lysophospholipase
MLTIPQVWDLDSNLIYPDENTASFYYDLVSEVGAKENESFPTQIVSTS